MAPDDPASATLDEWRKVEAEMQAGHEIRDGGKPFTLFDAAPPLRAPGPRGAGLCACCAASGRLQSDVGRRRWHGEHLDSLGIGHKAVARVMLDRRKAEEAPMARDPDPASATLTAIRDEALGSIAYAGNHACPDAGSSCSAHNALRLLAAVEAVLKDHQPGRVKVFGYTCKSHEQHRFFSITSTEAGDVRACGQCTATVYNACTGCGPQVSVDACPVREAVTTALTGQEAGSGLETRP